MDQSTFTAVIGTLCGVIAFLYKREAARADRLDEFQRKDMNQMISWYARATLDYARIMRGEMPHDALSPKEETTQIVNNAGSKRSTK